MNMERLRALKLEVADLIKYSPNNNSNRLVYELLDILTDEAVRTAEKEDALDIKKPPVRNLIYHITPMGNWKWNVDQLVQRQKVFTGQKVFVITHGKALVDPEEARKFVQYGFGEEVIFYLLANHPTLRETHSLGNLLLGASQFDRDSVTFYGHTKGVTRADNPAVALWTKALYRYNLDYIDQVDTLLEKFPVVGACKRHGSFKHFPASSRWHYSGTFFWFRNKDLFEKQTWPGVVQTRYGAEAYLSGLFPSTKAGCVFGDNFQNGYNFEYMAGLLSKDEYFKERIAELKRTHTDRDAPKNIPVVRKVAARSELPPG